MDPSSIFHAPPQPTNILSSGASLNPPRIFGNYSADGSLQRPSLSEDYFQDSIISLGPDDQQDHGDPKRRRIAKACDPCRRKKIKCDGRQPCCSHCENYKTECIYTQVEKKRAPPKGAKYIEGLENRLGRMEQLLKMSGLVSQEEANGTDLRTLEERLARQGTSTSSEPSRRSNSIPHSQKQDSAGRTPKQNSFHSPSAPYTPQDGSQERGEQEDKVNKKDIEALSDMMCSLVTNNCGESRYIGSSSGFSIFSPKGIQWVSEKTGDDSFMQMVAATAQDDNKWFHWRQEVFQDIFNRRISRALPPKDECVLLVTEFFQGFNQMFPLFHERTFRFLLDKQYSNDPYDGSGWWAAINVVIAIAYRIRVMRNQCSGHDGDEDTKAWAYFKNALAVHSELTLRNTDLLSVQSLIGMAIFMQGTPNPQPSFSLIGSAVRLMHSIGLHKRASGYGLNTVEVEQRKRVFWVAYIIDKDCSLRSGRPPSIPDEDWNVDLPELEPPDGLGVIPTSAGETVNLFRKSCEYSVIASKVYDQLYSVRASKQSDGELLNTIGDLDFEIEEWKDSIPLEFRPEHELNLEDENLTLQLTSLHFAYYNCVSTIHRMSVHHGYWTNKLSEFAIKGLNLRPLNPRVFSSAAICVQAARSSISLLRYIPPGDFACVWLIIYYPVSALVTLFANVLQNPTDVRVRADLKLMSVVVNFLSRICVEEDTGSIRRMYLVSREFERIAKVVLSRAEKEMSVRQRRKQEREQEKVDDNIASHSSRSPHGRKRSADALRVHPKQTNGQEQDTATNVFAPEAFGDLTSQELFRNSCPSDGQNGVLPKEQHEDDQPPDAVGDGLLDDFAFSFDENTQNVVSSALPSMNNPGAFQQPFVPQDLWSMSQSWEWDWQDLANSTALDAAGGQSGT